MELGLGGALNSSKQSSTESGAPLSKAKSQFVSLGSIGLGYKYSEQIKLALDVSYLPKWRVTSENKEEPSYYHAEVSSVLATVNGFYDFPVFPTTRLRPYLVAGLGVSRNEVGDIDEYFKSELSTRYYGHNQYNLAWKVGAGVTCSLSDRAALNFGYNFISLGRVATKISGSAETHDSVDTMIIGLEQIRFKNLYSHQLLLGLRISL